MGNLYRDSANGVYATIAGLADHLPQNGVSVEFWHLSRKVSKPTVRDVGGITVVDLPRHRLDNASLVGLPRSTRAMLRERARNVDIVHMHSVYQVENIAISRLRLGRPLVLTPNGGYSEAVSRGRHRISKSIWRSLWENRLVNGCSTLHAVSHPEVERLTSLYPSVNVCLVPNAVALESVRESPLGNFDGVFVFVGRLAIDHKGLDLLLEAYAAALGKMADLPSLIIAGPDFRGGRLLLEEMVERLGLRGKVTVVEPVFGSQKAALLASARCFVHTSRWEGFPFAVVEAMAAGLPVMVTPGTNMASAVSYRGGGVLVEPTTRDVASGLLRIATLDEAELNSMAEAASATVRDRYTWEAVAPLIADLYRRILDE